MKDSEFFRVLHICDTSNIQEPTKGHQMLLHKDGFFGKRWWRFSSSVWSHWRSMVPRIVLLVLYLDANANGLNKEISENLNYSIVGVWKSETAFTNGSKIARVATQLCDIFLSIIMDHTAYVAAKLRWRYKKSFWLSYTYKDATLWKFYENKFSTSGAKSEEQNRLI
jgi:hypothetical protein